MFTLHGSTVSKKSMGSQNQRIQFGQKIYIKIHYLFKNISETFSAFFDSE